MKKAITIALLLVCSYSIYTIGNIYYVRNRPIIAETANTPLQKNVLPKRIKIPAVNIDLNIFPSTYKGHTWEYTDDGVSYLSNTPIPGAQGNSVFYGHNRPNLLGSLNKVNKGDYIEIDYSDGSTQKFEISSTFMVSPDQTHILNETDDSRITLYTCVGFLDLKRWVVVASKV